MSIDLQKLDSRHLSSNLKPLEKTKPSLKADQDDSRNRKLEKACQDFESIFVAHMMKTMRTSTLSEGGLFGGDNMGGDFFQEMFEGEVANQLSRSGGMGLADQLYRGLAKYVSEMSTGLKGPDQLPPLSGPDPGFARQRIQAFDEIIHSACRKYDVDPALVSAVIERESSGNPGVVSSKGAKGLMQLMDGTAGDLGVKNSFDPEEDIMGGTRYLSQMLDRFDGDVKLALAAYNAGPGNVEKYEGIPPFKETETYVSRVLDSYEQYRKES